MFLVYKPERTLYLKVRSQSEMLRSLCADVTPPLRYRGLVKYLFSVEKPRFLPVAFLIVLGPSLLSLDLG